MQPDEAMRVLDLAGRVEDLSPAELRRQYRRKAREHHPDKSAAPDATAQFLRVKAAMDVLEAAQAAGGEPRVESLIRLARAALAPDLCGAARAAAVRALFDALTAGGGARAEWLLDRLDYSALRALFAVLDHARRAAGLPEAALAAVRAALEARRPPPIRVLLRPSLEDLFAQNAFVLREGGTTFVVPLWASEVVFEDPRSGADVEVRCAPELPAGASIDERNNITVEVELDVRELWARGEVRVAVGAREFDLRAAALRLAPLQTVLLSSLGAPAFDAENIYSTAELAGVFARVRLSMRDDAPAQPV